MTVTIYGIKNCDTMKKARAWLDKQGVDYAFHDYKVSGIDKKKLESWVKKARAWLDKQDIDHRFHDYKVSGIEKKKLESWAKKVGWETLLNRAGTTFRKLPDKEKEGITEKKAIALMLKQPSMIKRPVLEISGDKLLVGFKPESYKIEFK